jgi:hypothetical protein
MREIVIGRILSELWYRPMIVEEVYPKSRLDQMSDGALLKLFEQIIINIQWEGR